MTCREVEKMVMPYIDEGLGEEELDEFLEHIQDCDSCREELEIYYTVSVGLRQLDLGTGIFDITGALEESLDLAWLKVRAARLRRVIRYAVETLCTTGVLVVLVLQLRIWQQTGLLR
ncbi:MAG: zf-HC2 domain-containing protein [Lachnospiraceae bacterium]|nr:zf-HC2 domain-containing protein [Lachnospiraceae bacterium]